MGSVDEDLRDCSVGERDNSSAAPFALPWQKSIGDERERERELLGPLDLTRAQTLCNHELITVEALYC